MLVIRIVAIVAVDRSACIPIGMTTCTVGSYMSTSERESGIIMVESKFSAAGRMALQASLTFIYISSYIIMLIIHI